MLDTGVLVALFGRSDRFMRRSIEQHLKSIAKLDRDSPKCGQVIVQERMQPTSRSNAQSLDRRIIIAFSQPP